MRKGTNCFVWVVLFCALSVASSAYAGSATWNGVNDGNWADPNNWIGVTVPGVTDTATFNNAGNGNTTVDLGTGAAVGSLVFDTASAAAYTIGAGAVGSQTLTIGNSGGITMNSAVAADQTVNALLKLGTGASAAAYFITNNSTTNALIFAGDIQGGLGGTAGVKTIFFGGTGAGGCAGDIVVSGNIVKGGASAIDVYSRTSGTLTLSGTSTIRTLYIGGSGIASSTVDIGSGCLILNNGGSTSISAASSGTINASGGGVLWLSGTGSNYGDNSVAAGQVLTINARLSGSTGFELYGNTGTIVLNNPQNNFAGDLLFNYASTIVAPVINSIGQPGAIGAGTNINFNASGGKFVYVGTGETTNRNILLNYNATIDQSGTGGTLKFASNVVNGASVRTLTLQGSTPGVGEIAGGISDNSSANTTAIAKAGSGTWTLSGVNTYSGNTTLNGGVLNLANSLAMQNSTLVVGGTGGMGALSFDSAVTSKAFTFGGLSGGTGAILSLQNSSAAAVALTVGNNNASTTYGGSLNGNGSLTKIGSGVLSLSGTNSYTGGTTVSGGSVVFLNTAAKPATGSVTVAAGATLGLGVGGAGYFTAADVDNLWNNTLSGVSLDAASGVAIDTTAGNFTYASSLSGSRSLAKFGAGTLVLTGDSTYTGGTNIAGGILQLGTGGTTGSVAGNIVNNGSLIINRSIASATLGNISGTGSLVKQGTGTLILSGNNTCSGPVTISDGSLTLANQYALRNSTVSLNKGTILFDGSVTPNAFTLGALAGTTNVNIVLQNTAVSPLVVTLTVGGNNASTTFAGNLSGSGLLVKTGLGTMTMQGSNSYIGSTTIAATAVVSAGTTNYPSSTMVLSGTAGAILGSRGINIGNGTLTLDNNAAGNNTNRLADTATIITNGNATLQFIGTGAAAYSETIGTLAVNNGYFQYTGGMTGSGRTSVFTIGTLTHGANSILNFVGTGLGSSATGVSGRNKVVINSGVTAGQDIGPWAVVNGADFAYYDTTYGVMASTSLELAAGGAGTSGANYKLTTGGQTLTGSTSYKTLLISGGTSRTLTATNMTINVGGISFTGQAQYITGGTLKTLATGTPLYINVGNAYTNTISSNIVDNGGTALVVSGGGNSNVLYLTGSNSYTGGTYLSNATLEVGMDAALGAASSGITVNGNSRIWASAAAFNLAASRTITLNNNSLLNFDGQNKGTWTVAGKVTGNGGISTGYLLSTIYFTNTANDFTGPIGIATYQASGNMSASFASLVDSLPGVPNSGLVFGNSIYTGTFIYTGATSMTFNNRDVTLAGTTGGGVIQSDGTGTLTFNGAFNASGTGSKTLTLQGANNGLNAFNSVIVDNSPANKTSVTKAGTGTWILGSTANTFTGTLSIAQGTLVVPQLFDNPAAVVGGNGVGNIVFGSTGSTTDSTLRYTGTGDYTFSNRKINLVGNGGTATIDFTGGANIILDASNIVQNQVGTKMLMLSSVGTGNAIATSLANGGSGSLGLGFSGAGSVWSLNAANTYTGATNVGPLATLKLNNPNAIAANNVGTLTVNGTLDLSAQTSLTTGALSGTAGALVDNITGEAVPYTLTLGNGNGAGSYAGTIQNTNGTIDLVKIGSGQQNLIGSNLWSGTTTISGGVLRGVLPSGNLVMDGGALETSASVIRSLGSGNNQILFTGNGGGFSAYGGAVTLDFSGTGIGAAHTMTWGTSGNALNLGGGQFILNGPAANSAIEFTNSLNMNDTASPVTRTIYVGANTATLSGVLSDGTVGTDGITPAGAVSLVKTGTGTLVLGGTLPNTYTGDTTIMNSGGVGGSTLVLSKPDNVIALPSRNIYIGNGTVIGDATLRVTADNQINPNAILNFAGTGNAKLELNNHTTTIGGIVMGSGCLRAIIQNLESGATGTGTLVIKSDTFDSTFIATGYNSIRNQTGKLAITKDGASTLTLGGSGIIFTGGLNIQNGTVVLSQVPALASVVNFPANSTGLLQIGTGANSISGLSTDAAFNAASVENVAGVNATLTLNGTGANTFAGLIRDNVGGGSLSLVKSGSGVLTLAGSASNTFTGGANINSGTVILKKEGGAIALTANGSGAVYLGNYTSNNITQLGTGAFATPTYNNQIDTSAVLVFNSLSGEKSFLKLMGNNQVLAGISDYVGFGVIEVTDTESGAGDSLLTLNVNNNYLFSGSLRDHGTGGSGVLNLVKTGTGSMILSGYGITYTGSTTVQAGTLTLQNASFAQSPIVFDANSTGMVEIVGGSTIGGLSLDPTATLSFIQNVGTGNATLILNPVGTGVFNANVMRDNPGGFTLALSKSGTGTAILSGVSGLPVLFSGRTVVSGGTLILGSGVTLNSAGDISISGSATLDLGSNTQISNGALSVQGTGSLVNGTIYKSGTAYDVQGGTISAALAGDAGLTKSTIGTLILSGTQSNTYTGPTIFTLGTTILKKTGGAYAIPGDFTITTTGSADVWVSLGTASEMGLYSTPFSPNTVINFANTNTGNFPRFSLYGNSITVGGLETGGTGTGGLIQNLSSDGTGVTGVATTATLTINNADDHYFRGIMRNVHNGTGVLAVVKTGAGMQTLAGTYITFTGGLTINAGTIALQETANFGSAITNNSHLQLLSQGLNWAFPAGKSIDGTGDLTKTGTGMITLAGSNTYSGTTYISAGTLAIGANVSAGAPSPVGNATSAILLGDTSGSTSASLMLGGAYTFGRDINVQAGSSGNTLTIGATGNGVFTGNVLLNNNVTISSAAANTSTAIAGAISGTTGNVTISGPGAVVLAGNNSYAGTTTVNSNATLAFGQLATLPSAGITVNGTLVAAGPGTYATAGGWTSSGRIASNSIGVLAIETDDSSAVNMTATPGLFLGAMSGVTYSGSLTPGGSGYLLGGGAGLLTVSSLLGDNGGPTALAIGTNSLVALTNGGNSYTGGTTVNSGATLAFNTGSLGGTGNVSFAGTLQWAGTNSTDLSSRLKMVDGTTATLDTNGNNVTFANAIGSKAGTGASSAGLTKTGSGTLTLNAAAIYTGATTVSGGTLASTIASGTPFGPGAMNLGGTLGLAPTGTGSAASLTGGDVTYTSGTITLNKGSRSSLTYTPSSLIRGTRGTLVIVPSSLSSLGTGEMLKLGTNAGNTNGIYSMPGIYAQDSASGKGTFVKYDSSLGLVAAESGTSSYTIYSAGTGSIAANAIADIIPSGTGTFILNSAGTAHAIRVGAGTLQLATTSSNTLTVVGNTIVMNPGATVQSVITGTGGSLRSSGSASDMSIYVGNGAAGAKLTNNVLNGVNLIKTGPGTLDLNSYINLNTLTINGGIITNNNASGDNTKINTITINNGGIFRYGTGSTNSVQNGAIFTINQGGTLDLNAVGADSIGAVQGAGTIVVGGNVTTTSSANYTFSGNLVGISNGLGITTSNGTLKLTGNSPAMFGLLITGGTGVSTIQLASPVGAVAPNAIFVSSFNGSTIQALMDNQFGLANTVNLKVPGAILDMSGTTQVMDMLTGTAGSLARLGYNGNLTVGANNGSSTFAGNITGVNSSLTKIGTGTLTLSGTSTFTGGVILNAGTLNINNPSALGAAGNTFTITGGAIDNTSGSAITTVDYPLNILGDFTFVGSNDLNLGAGSITVGTAGVSRTVTVNASTLTLGGAISGPGSLVKAGPGTLILNGTSTYDGDTIVTSGTLSLVDGGGQLAIPAQSTLDIQGGEVSFGSATSLSLGGLKGTQPLALQNTASTGVALTVGSNDLNTLYSGAISGAGSLIKTGLGVLTLRSTNSFTGGMIIDRGKLNINSDAALGASTGSLTFTGNASLQAGADTITLSSSRVVAVNSGATAGFDTNGYSMTIASVITGSGGLAKTGSGTLMLSAANSYTGGTTISQGTLQVGGGGTAGLLGDGLVTINPNATLAFDRSDVITVNNNMVNNGTVTVMKGMVNLTGLIVAGTNSGSIKARGTLTDMPVVNIQTGADITGHFSAGSGAAFGMFNQSGGTTKLILESTIGYTTGNYGFYNLTGGTMNCTYYLDIGLFGGVGMFYQSGGTMNTSGGWLSLASYTSSIGVANFTGGLTNFGTGDKRIQILGFGSSGGNAQVNINGGYVVTPGGNVQFDNASTNTGNGYLTLKAGTLETSNIIRVGTGAGYVNFNGGTFKINPGGTGQTMSGLNAAYVHGGGAVIDTNGQDFTIAQALLSPVGTGNGITTITASNVSGYAGAPYVQITDATGSGATAVANVDANGAFDGTITVTSPGTNYTATPTVTLIGGGGTGVASVTAAPIISGGLNKVGSGNLILSGTNTFSGDTVISGGTLGIANASALAKSTLDYNNYGGSLNFTNLTAATFASLKGNQNLSLLNIAGTGVILTIAGTGSGNVYSGALSGGVMGSDSLIVNLSNSGTGVTNTSTFALIGNNSFNGGVTVTAGQLQITNSNALGVGTKTITMINGNSGNCSLALIGTGGNIVLPASMSFVTSNSTSAGTIQNVAGDNVINGNVTLAAGGGATMLTVADGSLTMNGNFTPNTTSRSLVLSGTGNGTINGMIQDGTSATPLGVQKQGPGTWTLTGSNSFSGGVTLNAGTLNINNASALGAVGGTFTINGGAIDNTSGGAITTLDYPLAILGDFTFLGSNDLNLGAGSISVGTAGASRTITVNASTLTLGGAISGTGNLVKAGSGTLVLNGTSSYNGDTIVTSGTLSLVDGSGQLAIPAQSTLDIQGGGVSFGSATSLALGGLKGTQPLALQNTASAGVALTVGSNGASTTYSGVISGLGSLTKTGSGVLTLSGTNTFTGGMTINQGTLALTNPSALLNSTLNYNAGNLSFTNLTSATLGGLSGSQSLALSNTSGAGVALTVGSNGASTTYSGAISGPGSLTKTGSGILTLSGSNSFSGGITLSQGTLVIRSDSALGASNGGILFGGTGTPTLRAGANNITLNSGRVITLSPTTKSCIDPNGNSITIDAAITGSGGLYVNNSGELVLTGTNSFSGGLTLYENSQVTTGVINSAGVNGPLGVASSPIYMEFATLKYTGPSTTTDRNWTVVSNPDGDGGGNFMIASPTTNLTLNGAIDGVGSLNKFGSGKLTVNGTNSMGQVGIFEGTLATSWVNTNTNGPLGNKDSNVVIGGLSTSTFEYTGATTSCGKLFNLYSGTAAFQIDSADTNLTLSGSLIGFGALVKSGQGTLTLSQANTFSGGVTLNAGTLNINNSSALGGATGLFTINGGVIDNTSGSAITTGNNPLKFTGDFTFKGTNDLNLGSGLVTLCTGSRTITVNNGTLTLGGVIAGSGLGLSKSGTGTLVLNGPICYSGATAVAGGVLRIGGTGLGSSVTLSGGELQLAYSSAPYYGKNVSVTADSWITSDLFSAGTGKTYTMGTLSIGGNTLTVANGTNVAYNTVAGITFGTASLTGNATFNMVERGSGQSKMTVGMTNLNGKTLTLTGNGDFAQTSPMTGGMGKLVLASGFSGKATLDQANTFSGGVVVNGGTLNINSSNALGSFTGGSSLTITGGAIDNTSGSALTTANYPLNILGDFTFVGSNDLNLGAGSISVGTAGASRIITVNASTLTLGGSISGTGSLVKAGPGTLVFSGTSSYTGDTIVTSGVLSLVDGGGQLAIPASSTLDIQGGGVSFGSATSLALGGLKGTQPLALQNTASTGVALTVGSNGASTTYSGAISGPGSLTKAGPGVLTLSGTNTFRGGMTISQGTLNINSDASLGASTGSLAFTGSGTLQAGANNIMLNSGRTISVNSGVAARVDTNGNSMTIASSITGLGSLTKTGTGTLTLSGTNTFTGGMTISQGTLALTNPSALLNSTLNYNAGNLSFTNLTSVTLGGLSGSLSLALTNTANAGVALTVGGNGANTTYSGAITGVGSLTKTGTGILTLTGTNGFGGGLTISQGTVALASPSALLYSVLNYNAGSLSFTNLTSATLSGLTGSQNLVLSNTAGAGVALTIGSNGASTAYSGAISGLGSLTKTGTGALTLSGTNSFTGGLILNAGTLNVNSPLALGSATGSVTINGGVIDNTSGGSVTAIRNGVLTLNSDFTFKGTNDLNLGSGSIVVGTGGSRTITVSGGTLTLNGNISGSKSLVKSGSGAMTLSATNSFSGGMTLNAGTLNINNSAALGLGTMGLTINGGAIDNTRGTGISLGNVPLKLNGDFAFKGTNDLNLGTGSITLGTGGTRTISANAGTLTLGGAISGTGGLVKAGSGALTLSGANSFLGGVTLNAGTLNINSSAALGSATAGSSLTINGGAIDNTSGSAITATHALAVNGDFIFVGGTGTSHDLTLGQNGIALGTSGTRTITANAGNLTLAGVISGQAGLAKVGSGTVTLNGANTYSGDTSLGAGSLKLANQLALQNSTLIAGGGVLFDSSVATRSFMLGGLSGSAGIALQNNAGSPAAVALMAGNNNANTTYTGQLSGAGSLTKVGQGTLSLGGTNSYAGGTMVSTGTLSLLNTAAKPASGQVTVGPAATLALGVGGAGFFNAADIDALYANTLSGVSMNVTSVAGIDTSGGNFIYGSNISGDRSLAKLGANTLTLTGVNTFTGALILNGGTLKISSDQNLGDVSSTLQFASDSTLQADANLMLADARVINLGAGANLLNATFDTQGYSMIVASRITGQGNLIKTGTGSLTLCGTNDFTGQTIVNQGSLNVTSRDQIAGNSLLTVGNGASMDISALNGYTVGTAQTLKGYGTLNVGSSNTLLVDGHLAPGGSIGTLTVSGDVVLGSSASNDFELGTPGTRVSPGLSDRTDVTGSLTLGGALNLIDNAGANGQGSAAGGSYKIFTQSGQAQGSFAAINNVSGTRAKVDANTSGSVYLDVYNIASPTVPSSVNLGTVIKGASLTGKLTVGNAAPSGSYTEGLNASIGTVDAGLIGSGGVTNLSGGSSDGTSLTVGADTSSAGARSGQVQVLLTSNGTNSGFADLPLSSQYVNVSGTVLDHSKGSFNAGGDSNSSLVDFGVAEKNSGVQSALVTLYNLNVTAGYTAGLRWVATDANHADSPFTIDTLSALRNLTAGDANGFSFNVYMNTTEGGTLGGYFLLQLGDQSDIPGYASDQTVRINLSGDVTPEPATVALLTLGGASLLFRRRRRQT